MFIKSYLCYTYSSSVKLLLDQQTHSLTASGTAPGPPPGSPPGSPLGPPPEPPPEQPSGPRIRDGPRARLRPLGRLWNSQPGIHDGLQGHLRSPRLPSIYCSSNFLHPLAPPLEHPTIINVPVAVLFREQEILFQFLAVPEQILILLRSSSVNIFFPSSRSYLKLIPVLLPVPYSLSQFHDNINYVMRYNLSSVEDKYQ